MNKDRNNRQIIVYAVAFVLIIVISFFYKYFLSARADQMIIKSNETSTEDTEMSEFQVSLESDISESSTENSVEMISVYLCGAIVNSGVYSVESGTLLFEVIELAGGFEENAASEYINLVFELNTNLSIYIPTTSEISSYSGGNGELIRNGSDYFIWGTDVISGEVDESEGFTENTGLININTASLEELTTLPGIGEATARAIIDYRQTNRFVTIEDIMNVSGIGESKFNRIRDYICV